MERPVPEWSRIAYSELRRANAEIFCFVPDEAISSLIDSADVDTQVRAVTLTTEEEGVAVCCGAWLGGKRSVLMMQSSGVGNCINAFTLLANCRFPCLLLVAMRGEFGEVNPWQFAMGRNTEAVLELAGFHVWWAKRTEEVAGLMQAAARMAWVAEQPVAILLSQQLVGAKKL